MNNENHVFVCTHFSKRLYRSCAECSLCWLEKLRKVNFIFFCMFTFIHLEFNKESRTGASCKKRQLLQLHSQIETEACRISTWGSSFLEYISSCSFRSLMKATRQRNVRSLT